MDSRLRGNDSGSGEPPHFEGKLLLLAVLGFFAPATTEAQQYPTKPIRLLTAEVGGGSDFTARLVSARLTENLGQQVVIDNRVGGVILGDIASKAQPDGYTLLLYSSSLWLMPYLRTHVPYRMEQFAPVIYISASPLILVVIRQCRPKPPKT